MNTQRMRNAGTFVERNLEALYARNKSIITALNELMKDTALVKHRKTLDEVAKAMSRVLQSDQKWSQKCQELQTELEANKTKVQVAITLSEEDKNVIDTLKKELQNAWDVIEEMNPKNCKDSKEKCTGYGDMNVEDIGLTVNENDTMLEEMKEDRYKLFDEIEKGKLQVFELEEEITNKDKSIEELTSNLNSKSKKLESIISENSKLKMALEESKTMNNKLSKSEVAPKIKNQSNKDLKSSKMIHEQITLKIKKWQDINKNDQISQEKVKHFIKKNTALNRQLQTIKNQNNLLKLQLAEHTRMLDLLSCQCCKLEEKDEKQTVTIAALKSIRDKYSCMIGKLEQKIHDMKKSKY